MRLSGELLQGSMRRLSPQPRRPLPLWEQLEAEHKQFTHGGLWWRDNYQLHRWYLNERPVVYQSGVYNGYKLLCRIGDWCWLTRDPQSGRYLTVKFLQRSPRGEAELRIHKHLRQNHSPVPHVAPIVDSFELPHHMAAESAHHRNIRFQALVYPATGTDIQRLMRGGWNHDTLTVADKIRCIQDVVRGLSALHRLGVVHGDLHAGNVALPLPPEAHLEALPTRLPEEEVIERKDGMPTSPLLPSRVAEPVDIGFSRGPVTILDLGYSFLEHDAESYLIDSFGGPFYAPPELQGYGKRTTLPLKVDSWSLGRLIFYIVTGGCEPDQLYTHNGGHQHVESLIAGMENGESWHWRHAKEMPAEIEANVRRILVSLWRRDPAARLAVADLERDEWLMGDRATSVAEAAGGNGPGPDPVLAFPDTLWVRCDPSNPCESVPVEWGSKNEPSVSP